MFNEFQTQRITHPTQWQLLTFHLQEIVDDLLRLKYKPSALQQKAIITALEQQLEVLYDDE